MIRDRLNWAELSAIALPSTGGSTSDDMTAWYAGDAMADVAADEERDDHDLPELDDAERR